MESHIGCVIETARARASRGAKLRTITIVDEWTGPDPEDELELREYALQVKHSLERSVVRDDSDEEN